MEIKVLSPDFEKSYGEFLLSFEEALLYYSLKYKRFLEKLLGCESSYQLAVDGDEILGVLPLMKMEGKYGVVINSLPYYGSNGGVLTRSREAIELLVAEYNLISGRSDVASATVITHPLLQIDYSRLNRDMTDKRIGQFTSLDLADSPGDHLAESFESSGRRNIRKAIKSGVKVKIDNTQIDFLMTTHQENIRSIGGKPKEKIFFDLLDSSFEAGKDYNIYIGSKDGQPAAALLLFYYHKTVEYYTPAVVHAYRSFQPLPLIIYEAMMDAAQSGHKRWNWGGTWLTQESLYRFKRKWGAEDKEYFYYSIINDERIYSATEDDILSSHPYFFVIPFHAKDREKLQSTE